MFHICSELRLLKEINEFPAPLRSCLSVSCSPLASPSVASPGADCGKAELSGNPEMAPQRLEKIEFVPGNGMASEQLGGRARGRCAEAQDEAVINGVDERSAPDMAASHLARASIT